jgi:hypothetical protein
VRRGGFLSSLQTCRPKAGGTNFWSTTRIGYVCMDVKFVQKGKHRSKRLPSKDPVNVRSLEINTPEQDIQENRQADNRKATEPDCAGHFRYLPKSLSADSRKERVKRYFCNRRTRREQIRSWQQGTRSLSIRTRSASQRRQIKWFEAADLENPRATLGWNSFTC